jgi:hypothetical protein
VYASAYESKRESRDGSAIKTRTDYSSRLESLVENRALIAAEIATIHRSTLLHAFGGALKTRPLRALK